jgi:hypothetical protein
MTRYEFRKSSGEGLAHVEHEMLVDKTPLCVNSV